MPSRFGLHHSVEVRIWRSRPIDKSSQMRSLSMHVSRIDIVYGAAALEKYYIGKHHI